MFVETDNSLEEKPVLVLYAVRPDLSLELLNDHPV